MRDYSSSPSNAAKKFFAYVSLSNNFERSSDADISERECYSVVICD